MTDNKYYFLNRPPGYGCQPNDYKEKESWHPKKFPSDFPRGAWGIVTYSTPLTFDQIWRFELSPKNPLEKVCYLAWQDCNKDANESLLYLEQYFQSPDITLDILIKQDDYTAADIKSIRDKGYTWPQVKATISTQGV